MSISLSPENADLEAEADRLCSLVANHVETLRTASFGGRFQIGDVSFRLHTNARNTVYRMTGRFDWFVKLPRTGDPRPVLRESLGAGIVRATLGAIPAYCGAAVIRASPEPAYVLTAAIRGKPLNDVLFTRCWIPGRRSTAVLERCFQTFGRLLAVLHVRARVRPDTPGATTRPFATLKGLLGKVQRPDHITDAISTWYETHHRSDEGLSFIHGNARLDNVVRVSTTGLGFLDFENCGTGSFYQDLSRPVSELLLTRCIAPFPYGRAIGALQAFLEGYSTTHKYEPNLLWESVGVRLARYYLEARTKRFFQRRIGGLPILKPRLDDLTLAVLGGPFEKVVPEIAV